MDAAYAAANVIACRAGALTISELSIIAKPCILVPSPNVSEDHQTHNAMSLVNKEAAILVKDTEAKEKLVVQIKSLLKDETLKTQMSENLNLMGKPKAAEKHCKNDN